MKYMLLIYHNEQRWKEMGEAERQQVYSEFQKLRAQIESRGQLLDGSQLQPTSTATSIRVRNGRDLVTSGPFAETHEQLGGYFLIDSKNLEEAIAVAKQIPAARLGTIEVRALVARPPEAAV